MRTSYSKRGRLVKTQDCIVRFHNCIRNHKGGAVQEDRTMESNTQRLKIEPLWAWQNLWGYGRKVHAKF